MKFHFENGKDSEDNFWKKILQIDIWNDVIFPLVIKEMQSESWWVWPHTQQDGYCHSKF